MTESEICSMFRGCANRKEQISIIQDLSLKTKNQIFKILVQNGIITEQDSDFETLSKFCKPTAKELEREKKAQSTPANKVNIPKTKKATKAKATAKPVKEEPKPVEPKPKTTPKSKHLEVVSETPVEKLGIIDISEENKKPVKGLSRETIVSYTIFQRKHGMNIDTIARDLGITRDDAVAICIEHIEEIGDTPVLDETNKRYIKDTLSKIDNYMSYIESFVKTDNIEGIAKVVDEQKKLLRIAQSLLR